MPTQEGVCIFCHGCSCAYVCIVSYTAGHRKECVTEVVRVKSADFPLSAIAGVKAPLRGTGVREITFQHIKSGHHDSVPSLRVNMEGV